MGGQVSILTPLATTIALDAYFAELKDIQYERAIGTARFLKTLRGIHAEGPVIVKVFIKPTPGASLAAIADRLQRMLLYAFILCNVQN